MIMTLLPQKAATIFIGLNIATVLTFNSPVQTYIYGGAKEDVFVQKVNEDRTLIIKPKEEKIRSNFLVITKDRQYDFYLEEDKHPHDFIKIEDGKIDSSFELVLDTKDYRLWEGKKSVRFMNKKSTPVTVNGEKIKNLTYLGKGIPVIIDGVRAFN